MRSEARRGRGGCKVVCAWCGGVIRRDSAKESTGMCLECYARPVSDYIRRGYRADSGAKQSER